MTVDAELARRLHDMYRNNATDETLDEGSDNEYNKEEDFVVPPNYMPVHSPNPSLAPQSDVPAGAASNPAEGNQANVIT